MIAVISGATGLTGSILVGKLLLDGEISQVISVSRNPLGVKSPKLKEIFIPELSEMSRHQAELKGDIYFCCLGTTRKAAGTHEKFKKVDYDAVLEFGKIAKLQDSRSFVLISSTGANSNSPFFYGRIKGEVENALQKMNIKRLVIFRPSFLVGKRKTFRLGERVFIGTVSLFSPILPGFIKKRLMTNAQDLAERMLIEGKNPIPGVFIIESHKI